MINVRLKIGDGEIQDTVGYLLPGDIPLGFVYLDSDKRVGSDQKGFESTTYPEEEGEHIIPRSVDAPFDYKAKFFIQSSSINDANTIITAFNRNLYTETNGVKEYKQVSFYNDYKRHKIVGYPKEIPLAEDFWRDPNGIVNDIVVVEWTIRVTKPSLCEYKTPFSDDSSD